MDFSIPKETCVAIQFISFPDIEGFHHVVKAVNAFPYLAGDGSVTYRGKIKLHGTNAGIRIQDGEVVAQSRTQLISVQSDNAGFARWVDSKREFFSKLPDITLFGEWCGPGIMKGTAVQAIPHKIFAVFAIVIGDSETGKFIHDPQKIEEILSNKPEDIHVLPWYGEPIQANFTSRAKLQAVADSLNSVVATVEPCDPWIKAVFGIEGTAEGVVYYPYWDQPIIDRKQFSDLAFKAKGEKHKVVKTKEAVQVDPEVAKSVEEFVALFVTEGRCEQGLEAIGGVADPKNTGSFLKWFAADVIKESAVELEAANLTWDDVQKAVQSAARTWFIAKSKQV